MDNTKEQDYRPAFLYNEKGDRLFWPAPFGSHFTTN